MKRIKAHCLNVFSSSFLILSRGALVGGVLLLPPLLEAKTSIGMKEPLGSQEPLELWMEREMQVSMNRIFRNISPSDARPGAIIAAQTRENPNYYYHWVRDAALTAEALVDRYHFNQRRGGGHSSEQEIILSKLLQYFEFSEFIQNVPTLEGLGEPKFHVDGSAFNEPWGRPQNDSPALRALSFLHLAQILIEKGQYDVWSFRFYNGRLRDGGVIKKDLEFISHQWRHGSFDLWEEVRGDHFYTRMVQRRALIEGAQFADRVGDHGAAQWYRRQAIEIEKTLQTFWDPQKGYIVATKNVSGGVDYKFSQLDVAVILGLLHGSMNDGFYSFQDSRVQSTLEKIENTFANLYPINKVTGLSGVAIGRYPEDRYGGNHFEGGNPWVLCTLALAEAYYRTAKEYERMGDLSQFRHFLKKGDAFVQRVQYHSHDDGSLNEQLDRRTGLMTSVEDLTWSYGSFLTAYLARH